MKLELTQAIQQMPNNFDEQRYTDRHKEIVMGVQESYYGVRGSQGQQDSPSYPLVLVLLQSKDNHHPAHNWAHHFYF